MFGQEIDILCHSASNPGRGMGQVEVFLKGRKYQMAGDMSNEDSWTMTIYNTQDFLVRSFFLKVIAGIQNFNTPVTLDETYSASNIYSGFNYSGQGSNQYNENFSDNHYEFLKSIGFGYLSGTMTKINEVYNNMRQNINSKSLKGMSDINANSFVPIADSGAIYGIQDIYTPSRTYEARPWYMADIVVQQLDHNDEPIQTTLLQNAFISNVGAIDYTDEVGDVSTTELTFNYSGIEYISEGSYINY
jgi:hypothetical protein